MTKGREAAWISRVVERGGQYSTASAPFLQRNYQQGVDLLAVEDDEALDEAIGLARHVDAVEIAAGRKEAHLAVMHDPHGNEIRMRRGHRRVDLLDPDRADDVAVAVRLENVGPPERH